MTGGLSGSVEGSSILAKYSAMTGEPATFLNILKYIFIEKHGLYILGGLVVLYLIYDMVRRKKDE